MGRLNAGQLNQRIALVAAGPSVSDGRGGQIAGPDREPLALSARVRPLKAGEKLALGQRVAEEVYEITIRRRNGVTAGQRVTWKGETLHVQAVAPDEYNEYLLLTCFDDGR